VRKYRAILSLVFLVILIVGLVYKSTLNKNCTVAYRRGTTISGGKSKIEAEVAKTEAAQEKGLSGRACIGEDQSMLFVFDKPDYYRFWMKDMKFPIDIVWIDSHKEVIGADRDISPSTYPSDFAPLQPAQYVLELKAGKAQALGFGGGVQLNFKLPAH
jgi:uncharacterized membrane protein (UPF0127 family)